MKIALSLCGAAACLAFVPPQLSGQVQDTVPVQVIEMTAKKYEYNPEEVHVKAGSHVQLKVRALDRAHGMKFKLYPKDSKEEGPPGLVFPEGKNDFRLEKDQVVTIDFVAERPGRYEFECSVFCGLGHHGMDGWLVVDPSVP